MEAGSSTPRAEALRRALPRLRLAGVIVGSAAAGVVGAAALLLLVVLLLLFMTAAPAHARGLGAGAPIPFPLFPADNPWNTPVDTLPGRPQLGRLHREHRARRPACTPISAPSGTARRTASPMSCVPGTQAKVPIVFDYADESDPGPYPIPPDAPIEGGPTEPTATATCWSLDVDDQKLYELYDAHPQGGGSWKAGSGAVFDLTQQRAAPGRLDLGRRRRAADPARAWCATTRSAPRACIDHALRFTVAEHAARVHLSGDALRQQLDRPGPAADGAARAAQGGLRHLGLPGRGPGDPPARSRRTG